MNQSKWPMWYFPGGGIERVGLNSNPLETVRSNIDTLTKEAIQNSLDARLENKYPVTVDFVSFDVNTDLFPDLQNFIRTVKLCHEEAKRFYNNDKKAVAVFEEMIEILSKPTLPFLRISDYNTTGLTGSRRPDKSNPWNNLTKAIGISDKTESSGGSYGIGKRAAYEASKIRTVLYSTLDDVNITASIGTCTFISFKDQGTLRRPNGYYCGDEEGSPLNEMLNLDCNHHRSSTGTDIFIPAYTDVANGWKEEVIYSAISNFFVAIMNDDLIVNVSGVIIDKNTIMNALDGLSKDFIDANDSYLDTKAYVESCQSQPVVDNNDFTLYLLTHESMRDVIGVRSNGMAIQTISRLRQPGNYSGVLVVNNPWYNEILRGCENPTHNSWTPNKAIKREDQNQARQVINKMRRLVSDETKKMFERQLGSEEDAYGLSDYLPLLDKEGEKTEIPTYKSNNDPIKNIIPRKPRPNRKDDSSKSLPIEDSPGSSEDHVVRTDGKKDRDKSPESAPRVDGGGAGRGVMESEDSETKKRFPTKILHDVRVINTDMASSKYVIFFNTETDQEDFSVRVMTIGDDDRKEDGDNLVIISAIDGDNNSLDINGNVIGPIKSVANRRQYISLKLDYPVMCCPFLEVIR